MLGYDLNRGHRATGALKIVCLAAAQTRAGPDHYREEPPDAWHTYQLPLAAISEIDIGSHRDVSGLRLSRCRRSLPQSLGTSGAGQPAWRRS